jgi:hypothetical protein
VVKKFKIPAKSVEKWLGFRVVFVKSCEKWLKSLKKLEEIFFATNPDVHRDWFTLIFANKNFLTG